MRNLLLRCRRCTWILDRGGLSGTESGATHGATLEHMDIGVRDLRNETARVIDAVRAGERVTLTVRGEPIADIVPHGSRTRWLSGVAVQNQLARRSADSDLRADLDQIVGDTLGDL